MRRLCFKYAVNVCGSTIKLPLKLEDLRVFEVGGMHCVEVKYIDITQNSDYEGSLLSHNCH